MSKKGNKKILLKKVNELFKKKVDNKKIPIDNLILLPETDLEFKCKFFFKILFIILKSN